MTMPVQRIAIIGIDSAPPDLIFDQWLDRLPNLRALTRRGVYGRLESTIPPITVPAWMSMMTSQDPGTLGLYGFRNRKDHSYTGLGFASSLAVKPPTLWELLGEAGWRSIVLGVPLTWPPKPVKGVMVSGFPVPPDAAYTYPEGLQAEVERVTGGYMPDVKEFRTENKAWLLGQLHEMTRKRFRLARHLISEYPWELFMMVEIGPDRVQHAFWRQMDPLHPRYSPGDPHEHAIRDYYAALDGEIGELVAALPEETVVLVVSDHGAKRMDGGIRFNEWLRREGYLHLKREPERAVKIGEAEIDWSRTLAWGDGGYYGRCFLNVKGREPEGVIESEDYERVREEIASKLRGLTDERGQAIGTRVYKPQEVYQRCDNVPPDLIVYFGDLNWRSVGTVGGSEGIWTHENDTGPDDANHSQHGLYVLAPRSETAASTGPWSGCPRRDDGARIYDIAPTLLSLAGRPIPPHMVGRPIL